MSSILYNSIRASARVSDRVLVGLSGGKDSVVALDLCARHFRHVEAYFLYMVRGLEFQEATIRHYEARYSIKVHRVPHFELSGIFRYGAFRPADFEVPVVSPADMYAYLRNLTSAWWIAGGERIKDSIWRRAILKKSSSIDAKRGRFYPIAEWSKREVVDYIRLHRLKTDPYSQVAGFSFRSLNPREIIVLRDRFPSDYERLKLWFPFIEASVRAYEIRERRKEERAEVPAEQAPAI